jgi:hypothetical protein
MTKARVGSLFKAPTEEPEPTPSKPQQGTKRGTHLISGMFEPPAYRQFGVLAAELGLDKRELLREALNDLFRKHSKPPIA